MTKKELIDELEQYDDDAEIVVSVSGETYNGDIYMVTFSDKEYFNGEKTVNKTLTLHAYT